MGQGRQSWNCGDGEHGHSITTALQREGILAAVVNARHVKQVPGRKTDGADSRWLAVLARCGLLRGSFIPPEHLGNLRLIARQKTLGMLSSEKNRLHKVLTDGGVRLAVVVSDLHGRAARRMIECLLEGGTPRDALRFAGSKPLLKNSWTPLMAICPPLTDSS